MRGCQPLAQLGATGCQLRAGRAFGARASSRPGVLRSKGSSRTHLAVRNEQQKEAATLTEAAPRAAISSTVLSRKQEGASTDLAVILPRLQKVGNDSTMAHGVPGSGLPAAGWAMLW